MRGTEGHFGFSFFLRIGADDRYEKRIGRVFVYEKGRKRAGIDIKEAINQIDRYKIHSYKGLFHFVQIFVVSNAVETRYFANTDSLKILKSLTFYWTNEINERINNLNDFSAVFFNQSRLSKMLNKYMVISDTEQILMVMRPYQIIQQKHW